MATLRFWTKTNKYWKRVADHWQNSQVTSDERCQFRSKSTLDVFCQSQIQLVDYVTSIPNSASYQAVVDGLEQHKPHVSSFQETALFERPNSFSKLQLGPLLAPMVCSIRSYSTNFSTDITIEKAPGGTNLNHSIKQFSSDSSKPSVLESMGVDRSETNNKDYNNDKGQDSRDGKQDENKKDDTTESAFLKNQRYAKWFLLGMLGIGTPLFVIQYGPPKIDEFGVEIKDQYSDSPLVSAYVKRAWGELNLVKKDIVEPSSVKLLPDPLTEPYYQPPYTLVIELMDVFLRPVYDSVSGWRFKKRPGIDYFLTQVGPPLYEIVIFTRETGMTAFPLIESMDQKGYIMYRLFRDAAHYKAGFCLGNPLNGELPKLDPYYQKDLKYLNRDLKRVILVDCDKRAFEKQPENGLCLEKWDGSSSDTTLYDLAGLLRAIASSDVDDVRPVLQHYAQNDKPIETFKLAQARIHDDNQIAVRGSSTSQLFAGAGSTVSSLFRRR